jgi:predicted DNA-binding transcriptional regulator AlpA
VTDSFPDILTALDNAQRGEHETAARAGLGPQADYLSSTALEQLTGTPASTWRYWAINDVGPRSFKLGRRRVWRRSEVLAWIASQEAATATGGDATHA